MIPRLKKKYTFDIKSGHYVRRINEDDEQQSGQEQQKTDAGQEQPKEEPKQLINIETAEIAAMKQQRDAKVASLDNDI